MSENVYDAHLARLSGRPGKGLQSWLISRYVESFGRHGLSKGNKVLEVGPGSGELARELLARGFHYTAVEPTHAMASRLEVIGAGRENFAGVYRTELLALPEFLEGQFDFVIAIHVLEHNNDPSEARRFVSKCSRLLSPGGILFVICPDYASYKSLFYSIDWSHGYETTIPRVRGLLEDVGFVDLSVVGTRASFRSWLIRFPLAFVSAIFPNGLIDLLFEILLKQKMLGSGFSAGFLKRNVLAVSKKPSLP